MVVAEEAVAEVSGIVFVQLFIGWHSCDCYLTSWMAGVFHKTQQGLICVGGPRYKGLQAVTEG